MEPIKAHGYVFTEPNTPFERRDFTIDSLESDEVVVKVAGCGLCHTDVSFYTGQVRTNRTPVILGHEVSGVVVATGEAFGHMADKSVVVPAVLPCGTCDLCRSGRGNICRAQKMPGNDFDGGFASHMVVPARFLCPVPDDLGAMDLHELSVIADAVTTPYQSLKKSGLREGDLAVVVGVGGIGIYMVQHARNAGAIVVAVDVARKKLDAATAMGASHTIDATDPAGGSVKKALRAIVTEHGLPKLSWRVFETSGTAAGQKTAFDLLSFAGSLGVVGFTMDTVTIRLSNVMAFDADVFGNWGCKPELYPAVVEDVVRGRINLKDTIEARPLDDINDTVPLALDHKLEKRVIFRP